MWAMVPVLQANCVTRGLPANLSLAEYNPTGARCTQNTAKQRPKKKSFANVANNEKMFA